MMHAKWKYGFTLFIGTLSNVVIPVAIAGGEPILNNGWFVGASAGAAWLSGLSSMNIDNGYGTSPDTYSINSQTTTGNISVEAGYRWERNTPYLPYVGLGLRYKHVFSESISGVVDEYSLPEYANYNYQMNASTNNIHAFLKLDLYRIQRLMPYFEGGIGLGVNTLSNYQEQALAGIYPRISPGFRRNKETNLSYALGAGFDYILSSQWWLTLGYQYIYQGNLNAGYRRDGLSSNTLNPGNIENQIAFIGASYQFLP